MNNNYLFAYGTLRKEFLSDAVGKLKDGLVFTGLGKIKAVLYDLGSYPAAVKAGDANEITGDVILVKDAEQTFATLDEYEGNEYKREQVLVQLENDNEITAWVYWYIKTAEGKPKILCNDYLKYLRNKSLV